MSRPRWSRQLGLAFLVINWCWQFLNEHSVYLTEALVKFTGRGFVISDCSKLTIKIEFKRTLIFRKSLFCCGQHFTLGDCFTVTIHVS